MRVHGHFDRQQGDGNGPDSDTHPELRTVGSRRTCPYDDNGNGRTTCAEARDHGIAPMCRRHPTYRNMNDRNGNGVDCEQTVGR